MPICLYAESRRNEVLDFPGTTRNGLQTQMNNKENKENKENLRKIKKNNELIKQTLW